MEIMDQVVKLDMYSKLADSVKTDSLLTLVNEAIELDGQNFNALNYKVALLFKKKNPEGLIEVSDRLFQLTGSPFYLAQKAMVLEFAGKTQEAKKYYSKAIDQYQEHLKSDTLNFNLLIEYIGVLEASGDSSQADKILEDMKEMNFEAYQMEIIDMYKEQSVSKDLLMKYWIGEIGYDQIR